MFESDVSEAERAIIFDALSTWKTPRYLEVGINFGGTFRAVLAYLQKNFVDFSMVGIDLFEDFINHIDDPRQTHQTYLRKEEGNRAGAVSHEGKLLRVAYRDALEIALWREFGRERFTLIKGFSNKEIDKLVQEFDVAFIDGNHSYNQTMIDYEAVMRHVQPGSIILFHNATQIEADTYPGGGPWQVCLDLRKDDRVEDNGLKERVWRFTVK